jgi:hypothetical protein
MRISSIEAGQVEGRDGIVGVMSRRLRRPIRAQGN